MMNGMTRRAEPFPRTGRALQRAGASLGREVGSCQVRDWEQLLLDAPGELRGRAAEALHCESEAEAAREIGGGDQVSALSGEAAGCYPKRGSRRAARVDSAWGFGRVSGVARVLDGNSV